MLSKRKLGKTIYGGGGLLLLLIIIGGSWWYLTQTQTGQTVAQIEQRGNLRVGLDASFPPFENLTANGEIVGLDVALAEEITADLSHQLGRDIQLEVINIGFDGLYDALLARRVDLVLSGLPYDPRRTEDVAYSINYFNAGQLLLVPENSAVDSVAALTAQAEQASITVAVEWGSQADMAGRALVAEHAGVSLLRRATAAEAVSAVQQGVAHAAIVDGVTGAMAHHAAAPNSLRIVAYLTDDWYVAAVHKDSQRLLWVVNSTFTRLIESGEMETLQAQWLQP